MPAVRSKWLLRLVCLLLLSWTAVDLGASELCALDNDGALTLNIAPAAICSPISSPDSHPPAHVDDCFCCSHCVNAVASAPIVHAAPVCLAVAPLRADAVIDVARPTYHPPKTSR